MTDTVQHILEEVKSLSIKDRVLIAHNILSSFETESDENVNEAWAKLSEQRYEEMITGKVKPVTWDEIKEKVRG